MDFPPDYIDRVKKFRSEKACSLQHAIRMVKKQWAMELLEKSFADASTKTLLRLLIQEKFNGA